MGFFEEDKFVLVGGLAIRYHLAKHSLRLPEANLNDLDIMVESLDVVSPDVTKDFLVYHFHHEGTKFYWALVDPITKLKIDIFDYNFAPQEVVQVQLDGHTLKMRSAEDQLVKTIVDVLRISEEAKVDPKQFRDAEALLKIADLEKLERFWQLKNLTDYPASAVEAWEKAQRVAQEHPEWLKVSPFRKEAPYVCTLCVKSKDFPITPMGRIYQVLGYVE